MPLPSFLRRARPDEQVQPDDEVRPDEQVQPDQPGRRLRVGVVGIGRTIANPSERPFANLYAAFGQNTGNYMFTEAVYRQISGDLQHIGFEFDTDAVNRDFDAVVIPAANWLSANADWDFLTERVEKLEVPAVTIGIGLQASSEDLARVDVSASAVRLAKALGRKGSLVSSRGEFTSAWLRSIGVTNVVTTGCPSLYMRQAGDRVAVSGAGSGLVLQSTRYPLDPGFERRGDVNRNLFKLAGANGLDMVYQSEMEEIELLVYGERAGAIDKLPDGLLAEVYGVASDDAARSYIHEHGRVFLGLDEWSRYLTTKSGVLGTRLHGAIIALNSGTPAVLISHDSRTAELASFARIPSLSAADDLRDWSVERLQEVVADADTGAYYARRKANGDVYRDFLRRNGLEPDPEGFADPEPGERRAAPREPGATAVRTSAAERPDSRRTSPTAPVTPAASDSAASALRRERDDARAEVERLRHELEVTRVSVRDPLPDTRLSDRVRSTIDAVVTERLTYLQRPDLEMLARLVAEADAADRKGLVIETGAALGGSAIVMASAKSPSRPMKVYDVFGMIPAPSAQDGQDVQDRYRTILSGESVGLGGDLYYGYHDDLLSEVTSSFARHGVPVEEHGVELVQGLFQDTLDLDEPVALAHLDGDWYESTMVCLERIAPLLVPGGRIVLDDYYHWSGCRRAVDEYFHERRGYRLERRVKMHVVRT